MSKIETMRSSANSVPQQRGIQSVMELQKTLEALNPAEIEQAMLQVRQTAAIYGELVAEQIVQVIEPLQQIIQQAQDVSGQLETTLSALNTRLAPPKKAAKPEPKQAPKPSLKDQVRQAMPWLLLGLVGLNMLTLAVVFLRV